MDSLELRTEEQGREIRELRARVPEAQETLRAIREGRRADCQSVQEFDGSAIRPTTAMESPVPSGRPATPVFDPALARARCFDSQRMVSEMIECFLGDTDDLLAQMRAALARRDLTEVGRLGHRIKGTVVYLGAESAKLAAEDVERFVVPECRDEAEAEAAVDGLQRECDVLKLALRGHPLASLSIRDNCR